MKYQKSWTQAVQEVYNISEDAKMGKQSDDQLKKIYKTATEKDQSSPANKSFTQRIAKEMKKRGINEIRWDLKDKGPEPAAEIIKGAGKQLKDYAIKSGGIDKDDFLTTADVLLKGKIPTEKQIPSDTDPREFVHGLMARKFGWKYVEQKYGIKFNNRKVFPEEAELDEKWKEGTYTLKDGETGKVLGKYKSGAAAQRAMNDLVKKADYENLSVELDEALDLKKLHKKYKRNESQNKHTENYLMLAKEFGTAAEVKKVQEIMKQRDKGGGLSNTEHEWMYKNINKYYDKIRNESVEVDEAFGGVRIDDLGMEHDDKLDIQHWNNKQIQLYVDKKLKATGAKRKAVIKAIDAIRKGAGMPLFVDEETELKEADYELYHKTFSGAMQHAYAHAKKKGFTVDNDEIDNKVAVGPKKPSSGKTNRYILGTDKKKNVHIQVANLDNKKYELNMYIEEIQPKKDNMDLKETIRQVLVNEILKKGDTVTVPHKGKMVKGKVVRYDKGGPEDPFYVVDVGENESPKIPVHKIKEDSDKSEPGTQGDDEEYAKKRDAVLKKYGVKSCAQCETDKEKKACFNDLDDAHVADHEEETNVKETHHVPGGETKAPENKVKRKAKEPQEQKEQSKLFSHIRKLMKGS